MNVSLPPKQDERRPPPLNKMNAPPTPKDMLKSFNTVGATWKIW